jgi:hypothetical protein
MTPVIFTMFVLIHGSTADRPQRVLEYTTSAACARDMPGVQLGLQIAHPGAVTYCHPTGAPVSSPLPMPSPLLMEAAR